MPADSIDTLQLKDIELLIFLNGFEYRVNFFRLTEEGVRLLQIAEWRNDIDGGTG